MKKDNSTREKHEDSFGLRSRLNYVVKPYDASEKLEYSAPRVIEVEVLEAAAMTCAPPVGGFGKGQSRLCSASGS